jgi:BirA family biotin operon repressor/biotin-[acetyl-CoA-carboxylase] ligase
MTSLEIHNPFNAKVYHKEIVESTMDISRELALNREPHGTVITADFQTKGRGRIRGREWKMEEKKGLPFTILLRFPSIEEFPPALTLRIGLAVSLAIEDFIPSLSGSLKVKWPNDILIGSKKTAGILCEADGGNVHAGIGINVSQNEFPEFIGEKAGSIALACGMNIDNDKRFFLLEKILARLYNEFETEAGKSWKPRLEERLYLKDEQVIFIEGAAGSGKEIMGSLAGTGENGELMIIPDGESAARSFVTGELQMRSEMKNKQQ